MLVLKGATLRPLPTHCLFGLVIDENRSSGANRAANKPLNDWSQHDCKAPIGIDFVEWIVFDVTVEIRPIRSRFPKGISA